jgi:hypothetical protein
VVVVTGVTRGPSALSGSVALLAGAVSLLGSTLGATDALPVALLGVTVLGVGVYRSSRRGVTVGAGALLAAAVVSGVRGAGPEPLLVGVLGSLVAWDVAEHGIGVGEQLGRETDTRRVELVHAASSLLVGSAGGAVGYLVFSLSAGGQPVSALVFLLVGVVALVAALRR